jgi:hypothetical protein
MIGVICQFVSCGTVLLSSVETYNKRNELTRTDENRKWHWPRFEGIDDGRGDGGVGFGVMIMEPGTLIRMIRILATIVIILSFEGSVFQCQESKGAFKLILSLRILK